MRVYGAAMPIRIPLTTFVDSVPAVQLPWVEEEADGAVNVRPATPHNYVWPDVQVDDTEPTMVVLVTAPGAMGKSAASAAVAHRLQAPLIDLARVPVGGDTLTGLFARVLGWTQTPELVLKLQRGETSLVLDSLDEAQLAAGRTHFLAFLGNVAQVLRGAAAANQVIIFGRRDTVETAYLAFEELGVSVQIATVAPLDPSQASDLIDISLDQTGYDVHRTHPEPFGKLRDSTLVDMGAALGSPTDSLAECWAHAGSFLGYPPVLLVLAKSLIFDNPAAELASRAGAGAERRLERGELLREITEGIMAREAEKVRDQLAPALGFDRKDSKLQLLYEPEEQVVRLLGILVDVVPQVARPASLSDGERQTYEELISTFVPDHPFLDGTSVGNVVFQDFLKAFSVTSTLAEIDGPDRVSITTDVGPFFSHFVHAMARRDEGGSPIVDEDLIDPLLRSFAAGTSDPAPYVYSMNNEFATLVLPYGADLRDGGDNALVFVDPAPSGILVLTSPISRGVVVTQGGISIQSNTDEIEVGPNVVLLCEDLQIRGRRLVATERFDSSRGGSHGVFIRVNGTVQHDADLRVASHPVETLRVDWAAAQHQWRPYLLTHEDFGVGRLNPETLWQVVFGVRRILTAFHASASDDPSIYYERLDRFAVGGSEVFQATLEGLMRLGVVEREKNLYRLRLAKLAEFDVSWMDIRGPEFAERLQSLMVQLLRDPSIWPLVRGEGSAIDPPHA